MSAYRVFVWYTSDEGPPVPGGMMEFGDLRDAEVYLADRLRPISGYGRIFARNLPNAFPAWRLEVERKSQRHEELLLRQRAAGLRSP